MFNCALNDICSVLVEYYDRGLTDSSSDYNRKLMMEACSKTGLSRKKIQVCCLLTVYNCYMLSSVICEYGLSRTS